jgi:Conserved TM helix
MNELWQPLGHATGTQLLITAKLPLLAQEPPAEAPLPPNAVNFFQSLGIGNIVIQLLGALAILLLGWIVASIVSGTIRSLLKKTDIDNRLAGFVTSSGRPGSRSSFDIEKLIASIVFWLIMILAIVASLNVLNLTTVSQPLNNFLNQIFAFLPRLASAAVLTAVAWLVATFAKAVVVRTAQSFNLDDKFEQDSDPLSTSSFLLSDTLGNAIYWFIFLFFLPLILGVLELQGPLQPVQNLLNELLAALPKIIKALAIGAVGWFVAKIVRDIVTNLLAATGTDQIGTRIGLSRSSGGRSLSWLIGTVVYVLILIPAITAALDALQIPAISGPATAMLNQVLAALPLIFTAAAILAISYVVGKFIADLATGILSSLGFDNIFYWLGIQAAPYTPTVTPEQYDTEFQTGETILQDPNAKKGMRSPSEIAGVVVLVGVMLFAAVAALNVLNIPALTAIVSGLLLVFGRILVGVLVFAVGLYLSNLAYNLITSSGNRQAKILGQAARVAIIGLVAAMALQQMGIATNIVNLAFGLLLGAIAVAIAIAFGLGGRDVAAEQLREWLNDFKR